VGLFAKIKISREKLVLVTRSAARKTGTLLEDALVHVHPRGRPGVTRPEKVFVSTLAIVALVASAVRALGPASATPKGGGANNVTVATPPAVAARRPAPAAGAPTPRLVPQPTGHRQAAKPDGPQEINVKRIARVSQQASTRTAATSPRGGRHPTGSSNPCSRVDKDSSSSGCASSYRRLHRRARMYTFPSAQRAKWYRWTNPSRQRLVYRSALARPGNRV